MSSAALPKIPTWPFYQGSQGLATRGGIFSHPHKPGDWISEVSPNLNSKFEWSEQLAPPPAKPAQLWVVMNMNFRSFPGGTNSKEPACKCKRHKRTGFDPCVGKILWRRAWQITLVFLPGECHGQRSLAGYSPEGLRVRHNLATKPSHNTFYKPLVKTDWGKKKRYQQCKEQTVFLYSL